MSTATTETPRVDAFFTVAEARSDRWCALVNAVNEWQASAADHLPDREMDRATVAVCLSELTEWEDFFAYPGPALLRKIDESIACGDAMGAARAIHQVRTALASRSYRENAGDGEGDESASQLHEA